MDRGLPRQAHRHHAQGPGERELGVGTSAVVGWRVGRGRAGWGWMGGALSVPCRCIYPTYDYTHLRLHRAHHPRSAPRNSGPVRAGPHGEGEGRGISSGPSCSVRLEVASLTLPLHRRRSSYFCGCATLDCLSHCSGSTAASICTMLLRLQEERFSSLWQLALCGTCGFGLIEGWRHLVACAASGLLIPPCPQGLG